MEKNKLRGILLKEGKTQADLGRASKVNNTTINKMCNGAGANVRDTTKSKVVIGLNALVGLEKYTIESVFPDNEK